MAISVGVHDHELSAEDLVVAMQPLEGYQLEREGSHAVALELALDDALRREGLAREVVHAVQAARKAAGLDVSDRIALTLGGADELLAAAREHEPYVTGETLTTAIDYDVNGRANGADDAHAVEIDGLALRIGVARA